MPEQNHSNRLIMFSALIQYKVCKPVEMQAFNFSLTNKRVFTVFDLLTSRQCIALQRCSSGVALGENGFVMVFIWTEWHTTVQWRQHKDPAHRLTIMPFSPAHPPYMQRKNRETPLDYTYSSRYTEQESHEVRTSLVGLWCPKWQEDTSVSMSIAECK